MTDTFASKLREDGRVVPTGLSASPEPEDSLRPTGFDPSRIEPMRRALAAFPADAVEILNALGDGEYVQSAHYKSAQLRIPERRIKEVHRALRVLGFADFGTLTREDDGAQVGSGYWATAQGERLAIGIEVANGR